MLKKTKNFHRDISFLKSFLRIVGLCGLIISIPMGVFFLLWAEFLGIIEEL